MSDLTKSEIDEVRRIYMETERFGDVIKTLSSYVREVPDKTMVSVKKKMMKRLGILKKCHFELTQNTLQKIFGVILLWGTRITLPLGSSDFHDLEQFVAKNRNATLRRFISFKKENRTFDPRQKKSANIEDYSPLIEASQIYRPTPSIQSFENINNTIFSKKPTISIDESEEDNSEDDPATDDQATVIDKALSVGRKKTVHLGRDLIWDKTAKKYGKRGFPVRIMSVKYFIFSGEEIETRDLFLVEWLMSTNTHSSTNFNNGVAQKKFTDGIISLVSRSHFLKELENMKSYDDPIFHVSQNIHGNLEKSKSELNNSRAQHYVPSINKYLPKNHYHKMKKALKQKASRMFLKRANYIDFVTQSTQVVHETSWSCFSKMVLDHDVNLKTNTEKDHFFTQAVTRAYFIYMRDAGIHNPSISRLNRLMG
jgi:hypothetical protein